MHVEGINYRTVWMEKNSVFIIEQNLLPFEFRIYESKNYRQTCHAIQTMIVRGAGAIGVTAGYAMAQAFLEAGSAHYMEYVEAAKAEIEATRPTARNLFYATERVFEAGRRCYENAVEEAERVAQEDVDACKKIGEFGNDLIQDGFNIETHCNAGWLAFTNYGSALSPIMKRHVRGKRFLFMPMKHVPADKGHASQHGNCATNIFLILLLQIMQELF